ncbi:hypothetical protein A0257_21470 [Hymenobacter psoromatis]|nr:hypothetical protein A0257_21470 [Hymenobacter psoromatis]
MVAQGSHQAHVLGQGVPAIGQQVAIRHLLLGHAQHLLQVFVLGKRALVAGLLRLGVIHGHSFAPQLDSDGPSQLARLIEQTDKVEAPDVALLAVVPGRTN